MSMFCVGLTGGIACGKSNALRCFHRLGAHTIDADLIAREVVEPGKPAHQQIVAEFGRSILTEENRINRKALGRIIFSDPAARKRLNDIVHPYVVQEEERKIADLEIEEAKSQSPIVVVDASLMIETGTYRKYRMIIVVYCPPAIQLQRLMLRDSISEAEARQRIESQMPTLEKIKFGDFIIETSGKLSETYLQVKQVYSELLAHYEMSQ
jgi:dephospho-CoA kinase